MPARPVAIRELFTGFSVVPSISGNVNRRPKPSAAGTFAVCDAPGGAGGVRDMRPHRWMRSRDDPAPFLSYYKVPSFVILTIVSEDASPPVPSDAVQALGAELRV